MEVAYGVKEGLLGFGKCLKRDGWVISIYRRVGDRYDTVKVARAGDSKQGKTPLEQIHTSRPTSNHKLRKTKQ